MIATYKTIIRSFMIVPTHTHQKKTDYVDPGNTRTVFSIMVQACMRQCVLAGLAKLTRWLTNVGNQDACKILITLFT